MEASGSPPRPTPSRRHRGLRAFGNPLEWSDIQKTILIFFPPIPFTLFYIWRIRGLLADPTLEPYISRPALSVTQQFLYAIVGSFVVMLLGWLLLRRREGKHDLFVRVVIHSWFIAIALGSYAVGPFSTPVLLGFMAGGMAVFLLFDARRASQGAFVGLVVIVGTCLLERAGVLGYGPVFSHVVFSGQRPPDVWVYLNLAFTIVLMAFVLGGIGLAMSIARARQAELNELLATDLLTGLANRRKLDRTLERELVRARRFEAPLSVVMIDLDHFKRVNDTHGHPAGDAVLSAVGRTVLAELREVDAAGRYGGEELLLVLPGTNLEGAQSAAERVRTAIANLVVTHDDKLLRVTASAGCATLDPQKPRSAAELVQAADAALYAAKEAGRDCVVLESGDGSARATA
ncbi:MAG: GGDEF domain-containing protein [Sandaracinaceae bacterium]|nr:GGDEF domain-containing protein [Sandaracinaceae bacterium]MBP7680635.1 GGDEF domain-containing protein [Deltaproteobacteria bacterium]MBK6808304.1 GGDEF domain-containing protein [Sandaracinaceae bacterium]MBK7151967.1 GGDEF domain-containing protein [Sandaracinaceae bacterium]MBK7779090.1 GGDEF domain-containing protein [Sandaracinaceae bacterium]